MGRVGEVYFFRWTWSLSVRENVDDPVYVGLYGLLLLHQALVAVFRFYENICGPDQLCHGRFCMLDVMQPDGTTVFLGQFPFSRHIEPDFLVVYTEQLLFAAAHVFPGAGFLVGAVAIQQVKGAPCLYRGTCLR